MTQSRTALPPVPLGPASVQRALLRQVEEAAAGIDRSPTPAVVHDTRKRIKRARAALALLRPALTEQTFADCDGQLRAAGRTLASMRDATVVARSEARMRKRAGLPVAAARARRPATVDPERAREAHAHLLAAADRLSRTRVIGGGWGRLGPGVRAVYRRGRRRRPEAAARPSTERLHAWRRHVKRLWHALELFEAVHPARIGLAIADARRLSQALGEDHDLAMLAGQIRRRRPRTPDDDVVLRAIADRRARLTRRALALGERVYDERARAFERRLHADWKRRLPTADPVRASSRSSNSSQNCERATDP